MQMEKEAVAQREAEEKADAMKALEHRTIDSKLEMDIMDALEETKVRARARLNSVGGQLEGGRGRGRGRQAP
jgi:hypothetical protein